MLLLFVTANVNSGKKKKKAQKGKKINISLKAFQVVPFTRVHGPYRLYVGGGWALVP